MNQIFFWRCPAFGCVYPVEHQWNESLPIKLFYKLFSFPYFSLAGCLIGDKGCASLAGALRSKPSCLRELDLSYNHPGESGVRLLSTGLTNPPILKYDSGRNDTFV